jgi:hypothetical protein
MTRRKPHSASLRLTHTETSWFLKYPGDRVRHALDFDASVMIMVHDARNQPEVSHISALACA